MCEFNALQSSKHKSTHYHPASRISFIISDSTSHFLADLFPAFFALFPAVAFLAGLETPFLAPAFFEAVDLLAPPAFLEIFFPPTAFLPLDEVLLFATAPFAIQTLIRTLLQKYKLSNEAVDIRAPFFRFQKLLKGDCLNTFLAKVETFGARQCRNINKSSFNAL